MDRQMVRQALIAAIDNAWWPPDDPEPRPPDYQAPSWIDNPNDPNPSEGQKADGPRFDGNLPLDQMADAVIALFRDRK